MKKGSLNLSINAIVVLIMAVALLGLGLGFLRNMFGNLEGQLGDISKDTEQRIIQDLENREDRLSLDKTHFEIKQGKQDETYIGLRNELEGAKTFDINGDGKIDAGTEPGLWKEDASVIACYSTTGDDPNNDFVLGDNLDDDAPIEFTAIKSRNLKEDASYVGKLIMKVKGRAPEGTYDCSVIIEDPDNPGEEYDRVDFDITVED